MVHRSGCLDLIDSSMLELSLTLTPAPTLSQREALQRASCSAFYMAEDPEVQNACNKVHMTPHQHVQAMSM